MNDKKRINKIACVLLTLVMLCTIILINPADTKAANKYVNIMHKVSTAYAHTPINYNFELSETSEIYFLIRTNERTGVSISVKEPNHDIPAASIVLAETNPDWKYVADNGVYENSAEVKLKKGKYILELNFENDCLCSLKLSLS